MITALSVLANERQPLLARSGSPRAFRHWCNADAFRQAGGSGLAVKPVAVKEQTQFGDPEISFHQKLGNNLLVLCRLDANQILAVRVAEFVSFQPRKLSIQMFRK
jgi:hypothetical protein